MAKTCQQLISAGITLLLGKSDSPELDAELLLSKAINQDRAWLFAYQDSLVHEADEAAFEALIKRRAQGEPIAYIFGKREFWSLPFNVSNAVLIPRPDTEILIETVLEHCASRQPTSDSAQTLAQLKLLDLGTGSGAIAIALASELMQSDNTNQPLSISITATDRSPDALRIAKYNAKQNHVEDYIQFQQGHWFEPLDQQQFDMIVSNPPYIAENDPHLFQGDVRFEPKSALVSGIDGLQDIHHIVQHAPNHLNDHGMLFLEHGHQQALAVQTQLRTRGFQAIKTFNDYGSNPRVTVGMWRKLSNTENTQ